MRVAKSIKVGGVRLKLEKRFVVFSGVDGAGKTTQIERVLDELRVRGQRSHRIWARGGYTPLFSWLKRFIRVVGGKSLPPPGKTEQRTAMLQQRWRRNLWLTVAIVDLALYYVVWVRVLRLVGIWVISDRYLHDTELDFKLNFPDEDVTGWMLWRITMRAVPQPDAQFLLLVPPDVSAQRSLEKNEPFPDSFETLEWRYARYREIAEQGGWYVLDGRDSIEGVHRRIVKEMGI